MSRFLVATISWAAVAAGATTAIAANAPEPADRAGYELRQAVRETLRRCARPTDEQADQAARELLAVFGELSRDDQLSLGQREQLRTKVRIRLMKLSEQIAKRNAIRRRRAQNARPGGVGLPANRHGVLAQQGGFRGRVGQRGFGGGGFGGGGFGAGGFGGGGGMGGGVLGPADFDHGPELVELIQKTISPGSWDINGGPGSIYYWRPGRAIVVRQTAEVHEGIGGVLQQLQRAGP